jgi:hypothetical protein
MISDVLAEAVAEIDRHLDDAPDVYDGELRARIISVRDQMDAVRAELDTPPIED